MVCVAPCAPCLIPPKNAAHNQNIISIQFNMHAQNQPAENILKFSTTPLKNTEARAAFKFHLERWKPSNAPSPAPCYSHRVFISRVIHPQRALPTQLRRLHPHAFCKSLRRELVLSMGNTLVRRLFSCFLSAIDPSTDGPVHSRPWLRRGFRLHAVDGHDLLSARYLCIQQNLHRERCGSLRCTRFRAAFAHVCYCAYFWSIAVSGRHAHSVIWRSERN